MTEPASKPTKRPSAIDTLVARDHTAVFWFLAACVVAGGCAWYITLMSSVLNQPSSFVVMDTSGAYFVPPGFPYNQMDAMHLDLTDLVVETMLERTPEGLVHEGRLKKLFKEEPLTQLNKELRKEERYFTSQNASQTVEIESHEMFKQRGITTVGTVARGKVIRKSVFSGKELDETFAFTLKITWRQNAKIIQNSAFPSLVEQYQLKLEKISDS